MLARRLHNRIKALPQLSKNKLPFKVSKCIPHHRKRSSPRQCEDRGRMPYWTECGFWAKLCGGSGSQVFVVHV